MFCFSAQVVQQLQLQQLQVQLRQAMQAGLIQPQLLNQPNPQILASLQQLLQYQNLVQQLMAHRQVIYKALITSAHAVVRRKK